MEENLEKYRALYNLLNDSTKSSLFGDGKPFGRNCKDRKLFKYFTDWIDELSLRKRLNPITIKSNTFIAHLLSLQKDENPEIAQIVNDIRRYHENKVISDEPLNNTLYQFAEIVDELKVTSDSEPGDVFSRYNDALSVASKLTPLGEKKSSTVSSETKPAAEKAGETQNNPEKSAAKPESGTKSESESKIKSKSSSSSEVSFDAESESTTETTSTNTDQKSVPGPAPIEASENDKEEVKSQPLAQKPVQPVQPAKTVMPVQPVSLTTAQPSLPIHTVKRGLDLHDEALTVESGKTNEKLDLHEPKLANSQQLKILLKRPGKRIVHRVAGRKGLRRTSPIKNGGPQKLKDPKEQGQNRQNAQASQPEATPEAEQFYNNQPNRIAEAAQLAQNQPETKSSFGSRFRKVAIASGVMGAGTFSLFSDDTAEAASSIVINFINLFLQ